MTSSGGVLLPHNRLKDDVNVALLSEPFHQSDSYFERVRI